MRGKKSRGTLWQWGKEAPEAGADRKSTGQSSRVCGRRQGVIGWEAMKKPGGTPGNGLKPRSLKKIIIHKEAHTGRGKAGNPIIGRHSQRRCRQAGRTGRAYVCTRGWLPIRVLLCDRGTRVCGAAQWLRSKGQNWAGGLGARKEVKACGDGSMIHGGEGLGLQAPGACAAGHEACISLRCSVRDGWSIL